MASRTFLTSWLHKYHDNHPHLPCLFLAFPLSRPRLSTAPWMSFFRGICFIHFLKCPPSQSSHENFLFLKMSVQIDDCESFPNIFLRVVGPFFLLCINFYCNVCLLWISHKTVRSGEKALVFFHWCVPRARKSPWPGDVFSECFRRRRITASYSRWEKS